MRDFALVLIVFGSIPFTLVRPQIGILMWYWISLMNPHRLTFGFAYDLRVALVVAAATLVAWLCSRERKLPPKVVTVWLLAAFTAWLSVTTMFALVPGEAFVKWQEVIKILGMTFVAMCIVNNRERIVQLVWVVALSLGYYGLKGGAFGILTGGQFRIWGPPGSFIEDNNDLALALIMILPLIYFLVTNTKQFWIRMGLLGLIGLTSISVLCSYSRGAFIALSITFFAFWLKTKRRLLTGTIGAIGIVCMLGFLPTSWYDRMDTISTYQKDTSANERLTSWLYSLRLAADHPVFGGGFNVVSDSKLYFKYVPNADAVHNFHSIYFQMLGENGYPGLILFLSLIFGSLFTAQSIIRRCRGHKELEWAQQLASSIQISIVGYCSAGAFLNVGYFDLFYVLIAMVTALKVATARELANPQPDTSQMVSDAVPALAFAGNVPGTSAMVGDGLALRLSQRDKNPAL